LGIPNAKGEEIRFFAITMADPSDLPDDIYFAKMLEEKRIKMAKMLDENNKIVVWWKHDGEIGEEFACGNTPEEVVDFMRSRSWIEEENKDSQKYMSGVQSRTFGPAEFLFYDEESFLLGLVKIDSLHIQKWEWEPDDSNSSNDS
jgi:hypothetical protein